MSDDKKKVKQGKIIKYLGQKHLFTESKTAQKKTNYKNNIINFPIATHKLPFDNFGNSKRAFGGAAAMFEKPVQKMNIINIMVTNLEKLRIIKSVLKDLMAGEKYGISEKEKTEFCNIILIMVQDLEKSIGTV